MMQQWKQLLASLSVRQRISIAVACILVALGLLAASRWKHEKDFKPLYTGMASEDAGAIVSKLKETAVEYRLSEDGATVSVPSAKLAEIRLQMAAAGLPKTGRIGFELFDKTSLGTSDFTEHVNYRRALEGELERSIKAVAEVEQARVHLTFPKDSVFLEARTPAKASVLLTCAPGKRLSQQNVVAIAQLVSSAVEGLEPSAVSIMDTRGNLLSRKNPQNGDEPSDELIEYRQKLERDLLTKISTTLEPLIGADRFRAGVSVDCDFTSGEQSEETYDPEKSVMTTSQKSEETTTTAGAGGVPGTAANLPRPPARAVASGSGVSRRTESIAYQSSRLIRKLKLPRGTVKRVSASILLDQSVRWEGEPGSLKRVLVAPPAESIRAIRELVAGVIGFTPDRGDQIVVESLPFDATLNQPPPPAPGGTQDAVPVWKQLQDHQVAIVGGVIVLLLILGSAGYLMRRRRKPAPPVVVENALPPAEAPLGEKPVGTSASPAKLGPGPEELAAMLTAGFPERSVSKIEQLIGAVRDCVEEDPSFTASVIRIWLQERAEPSSSE